MRYQVLGNGETVLKEGTLQECREWLRIYIRGGDWGGWEFFSVLAVEE